MFLMLGDEVWIPVSVQAHHSFMDGLHIGQFVEKLQKYFEKWEEKR